MQRPNHITRQELMEGMQFAVIFVVFMSSLALLFILAGAK